MPYGLPGSSSFRFAGLRGYHRLTLLGSTGFFMAAINGIVVKRKACLKDELRLRS